LNKRKEALEYFGKGLHPLQDIDAHMDWDVGKEWYTPPFAHYAYFDDNFFGIPGALAAGNWDTAVFDDPQYDLKKEMRTLHGINGAGFYTVEAEVYIARPGTTRYSATTSKTITALQWFKNEVQSFDLDLGYFYVFASCGPTQ